MGGRPGFMFAILLFAVLAFLSISHQPPFHLVGSSHGLCFPSPEEWPILPDWSGIIAASIVLLTAILLIFFDKTFNVTRSPALTPAYCYLILNAASPWVISSLTSSSILGLASVACLWLIFGRYEKEHTASQLCVLASILSFGSMFECAFLFMMPVFFVAAIMMGIMNLKGIVAFLIGIITPYWCLAAAGVIDITTLRWPEIDFIFSSFEFTRYPFLFVILLAVTLLLTLILSLNNAVALFSAKKHIRFYNAVVNTLGTGVLLCFIFNYNNLQAYVSTLFLATSIQMGNSLAKRHKSTAGLLLLIFSVVYIAYSLIIIYYPS